MLQEEFLKTILDAYIKYFDIDEIFINRLEVTQGSINELILGFDYADNDQEILSHQLIRINGKFDFDTVLKICNEARKGT